MKQNVEEGAVNLGRVLLYERIDPRDDSPAWLREQGFEVVLGRANDHAGYGHYTDADLIEDAQGCVGLLGSGGATIDRRVIEALPQLRYIAKIGIGVDNIDVAAATGRGIRVTNTLDGNDAAAVAEHAIALLLALRKRLSVWTPSFMRSGGWRGNLFSSMLQGSTVGVVGFGRIGRAVAHRLSCWDVEILAYDPFAGADRPDGVTFVALDELLARSDAVTLHCPPTDANFHLIDADALALMKRSAVLINTGRGSLVDSAALRDALAGERLAGAALDVYESEPPDAGDALFVLPNVIATPHVASWTLEGYLGRRRQAATNLLAMARGDVPENLINPAVSAVR
ncbi:NAD(P)-dependent oxidoreductase [Paraburkholderia sp. J12]|uniref:NAD(P)-dependent oxidoreductase n=1 Tax=Paraburkholderia sp. J12 TaxID=2805432 RepID=UPI002ABE48EE|nr:NAD(P)-dependent oxidoreductase [Paraburkholderia sp. J12]